LEFRAVVVPDLGRGPKLDNRMPALDDALGVVGGPIDASGRVVTGHLGLEEHRRKELDRERAEQARLFYVACTRAEDVLVLLEGKGDARYLREEKGERHVWCHQVWDVLERARVATFVVSGAPEETLALAGGGARATRLGTAAHGVLEAVDLAAAPDGEIARLVAARPEALALRSTELDALAADLRAATAALRGEIAAGLALVGREVPFVLALP